MTQESRTRVARATLGIFAVTGVLCAGAALLFSSPDLVRQACASSMGAVYLGSGGVERQKKRNECGAASLKMVFDHAGIPATPLELRRELALTRHGTSMLALKQAAEKRGLHAAGWRLTTGGLSRIPTPAILLIHGDHFVVMDSVSGEAGAFLRDPALGRLRIGLPQLARIWRGETLVFWCEKITGTKTGKEPDYARWSAEDRQTRRTRRIVPRDVVQVAVNGGRDAAGGMSNQP